MKINSNDLFFAALYLWLGTNITQVITDLDVLTSAIITTIALASMAVYHHAKNRFHIGRDAFLSQIDELETQIAGQKTQIAEQKSQVASQNQKFVLQIANAEEQNETLREQNENLREQNENLREQIEIEANKAGDLQSQINDLETQNLALEKTIVFREEEIEELKSDAKDLAFIHDRVVSLGWSLERFKSFIFDDYNEANRKITLSKQIQTSNAKVRT